MKCKKKFPDWMNEKQAACYIGKSQEFLRKRRIAESARYETKGPLYLDDLDGDGVRYRAEDLNDWLRLYRPSTKAATKKYRNKCRSSTGTPVQEKTFGELLRDLEKWMGKSRPEYLLRLKKRSQDMSEEFSWFNEMTDLELPEDYKSLLSWGSCEENDHDDTFDPFSQMGFFPLASAASRSMFHGDFEDEDGNVHRDRYSNYSPDWLPFMSNGLGSELFIDLSPERYGKVYYWCGEKGREFLRYENLREWLAELVSKLQFLNADVLAREIRAQEEYYELNGYPELL